MTVLQTGGETAVGMACGVMKAMKNIPEGERQTARYAAIDIGSNTVQLLLAEVCGGRIVERQNEIRTTRLGAGNAPGLLSVTAIRLTAQAVAEYMEKIRQYGASRTRIIATSAVRDAANRELLLSEIRLAAPEAPAVEVVSGKQEAALSFRGAHASLEFPLEWPVVDVGGASSELIFWQNGQADGVSADVGAVRVMRGGWSRAETAQRLHAVFDGRGKSPVVIGVGGTITTAAGLLQGLTAYDRARIEGQELSLDGLASLLQQLTAHPRAARCSLSPLLEKRGEIIVEGLWIWLTILAIVGAERVVVTGGGLLDGAVMELVTTDNCVVF